MRRTTIHVLKWLMPAVVAGAALWACATHIGPLWSWLQGVPAPECEPDPFAFDVRGKGIFGEPTWGSWASLQRKTQQWRESSHRLVVPDALWIVPLLAYPAGCLAVTVWRRSRRRPGDLCPTCADALVHAERERCRSGQSRIWAIIGATARAWGLLLSLSLSGGSVLLWIRSGVVRDRWGHVASWSGGDSFRSARYELISEHGGMLLHYNAWEDARSTVEYWRQPGVGVRFLEPSWFHTIYKACPTHMAGLRAQSPCARFKWWHRRHAGRDLDGRELPNETYCLNVPYWALTSASMTYPMILLWLWLRRRHRFRRRLRLGLCVACGYDLRAHAPGEQCPECGRMVPQDVPRPSMDAKKP